MALIQALSRNLHALDARTGAERWRYNVPAGWKMNGTPAAHDGKILASIYIDNNGAPIGATMMALDDATGKVLWQHRGGGSLTGAAIARDRACFGSTNDVFLSCVDLKGALLWRYRTGGLVQESCPAISGNRMFVLVANGYLYAME
jgi:outer membrane protein assembly factor BamB